MNKNELIEKYAGVYEISKAQAKHDVECLMDLITGALAAGDDFEYPGFGKLVIAEQSARTARNPKTGDEIAVPAKNVVKFKVAKALKDAVANS